MDKDREKIKDKIAKQRIESGFPVFAIETKETIKHF